MYFQRCLLEISKRQSWYEDKKTRVTEIMQMFVDNNKAFDFCVSLRVRISHKKSYSSL